jgi:hypothetical protein
MSKKSPWLYHFHVPIRVSEKIEIDPIKDEDGNEIQQFKTIEKEKPFKCAIKKPNRALYEEGELFYSVEVSKYIQAGMLTKTLLAKRFANDGGTLTEEDQQHYAKLYSELHSKEQEVQRIQLDTDNAKKRAKKLQDLIIEITSIRQQLVEFESTQSSLFDQTAEHKARNRTILWWVLNLSYIKQKGEDAEEKLNPLFEGSNFQKKLESYDEIEEDEESEKGGANEHLGLALKKFAYFISFWYSGQAIDKEGFKAAEELLDEVDLFQIKQEEEEEEMKKRHEELSKEHIQASLQQQYEEGEAILNPPDDSTPEETPTEETPTEETPTEETPTEETPTEETPTEETPTENSTPEETPKEINESEIPKDTE